MSTLFCQNLAIPPEAFFFKKIPRSENCFCYAYTIFLFILITEYFFPFSEKKRW